LRFICLQRESIYIGFFPLRGPLCVGVECISLFPNMTCFSWSQHRLYIIIFSEQIWTKQFTKCLNWFWKQPILQLISPITKINKTTYQQMHQIWRLDHQMECQQPSLVTFVYSMPVKFIHRELFFFFFVFFFFVERSKRHYVFYTFIITVWPLAILMGM